MLSVRFTGGEPLLRTDFTELYLFTRRLGIKVQLFTNARLITPEIAELFSRVPPLNTIEVSVYGMHPETYDTVACAAGAFAEFWRGIKLLQDHQIPFRVTFVQLPPNRADLEDFESWTSMNLGTDAVSNAELYLDLRTRRDSPGKNRLINSLRITPQESLRLLESNHLANPGEMAQFCARFIGPRGNRLFTCGAGTTGCVDAYGIYQMCMLLRHPDTVYHLSRGTLRDALIGFFPPLRDLRATNPEYLQRCARCFLMGFCEQCPAKSWSEHGTLDTPVEYLCEIAHARARYLQLICEGEFGWEVSNWRERVDALVKRSASLAGI